MKLTYQHAQAILMRTYALQWKEQLPFPVALCHSLPKHLQETQREKAEDIFYSESDEIAHEKFYKWFVEEPNLEEL